MSGPAPVYIRLEQVPLVDTYVRDHIGPPNPDRIRGFLDNIRAGVGVPVVQTRFEDGRLRILDGRHRWLAHHLAGHNHILVTVETDGPGDGALPLYHP